MNFGTAIKTVFTKYADFRGVASRSEYWWWFLFTALVSMAFSALSGDTENPNSVVSTLSLLWSLGTFIPSLAVAVRRFHDAGFSGKWLLLYLVPFVLFVVATVSAIPVIFGFLQGTLAGDQLITALGGLAGVAVLPIVTGLAMWIFNLVVTLRPTKSAAEGNTHAA